MTIIPDKPLSALSSKSMHGSSSFTCRLNSSKRRKCTPIFALAIGMLGTASTIVGFPNSAECLSVFTQAAPRLGQLNQRYVIRVSQFFEVENVVGRPGVALPLRIRLSQPDKQDFKFLMFRRMPANFSLSAGFGTRSSWVISLNDVDDLSLMTPRDARGTFELDVLLFRGEGAEPERGKVEIVVQSDAPISSVRNEPAQWASQEVTAGIGPSPSDPLQNTARLERQKPIGQYEMTPDDKSILIRGYQLLEQGNVTQARLFYQHLANKGVPAGALAMAQTYDAKFLTELGVQGGLKPDPIEAKKWYDLSSELLPSPPATASVGSAQ